jgi:hypothetical protein
MIGNDLIARVAGVEATQAEIAGREYVLGSVDCGIMVLWHLMQLGYVVPVISGYSTVRGGLLKLKRLGFDSIPAFLDSTLEPIAPARMMVADVGQLQGDGGDALVICAGQKLIGFREGFNTLVNQVDCPVERAWRV